jgi:hypothetical protein
MHEHHADACVKHKLLVCRSFENLSRTRGAGAHYGPKEAPPVNIREATMKYVF